MTTDRRTFLRCAATSVAAASPLFHSAFAQAPAPQPARREFNPQVGAWRTFDVTTRVDIAKPQGTTQVWLPVPTVESDWQRSFTSDFRSNGNARLTEDRQYGARMLQVSFELGVAAPYVELTSRVQTRNRAEDFAQKTSSTEDAAGLRFWTQPTRLLPTDGIVRDTAIKATRGARTDVQKAQQIYDWVVANTYREPKVRGCGEGDIKTMLETGNLGGKCADLNAIFVGLCRAAGLPARDVYGIRLAPSAFGYKELSGNPASLKGAQHCRAEVHLAGHGWVAMDPADVAKVMRLETPDWIKTTQHPVVAPVNRALFGGWEGNWMAWNMAHDVKLPQAQGPELGFFMYPTAETGGQRLDSYAPDDFKYQITAREVRA
ncbi:transglutaminase family protein [Hydrogenophaga sp. IBVHS1]|uniref:transglutaminase-like domain-containing protein n=1 Tax=unclassified Hydrogenophaga TaxID=2610897 RepID=UPI000A2D9236|nr:transglutaminase domain-containing protein [Hydrogenophaga sp. IBVHS1]OSZ75913.1 transglutaminase [Hydrogenophaga sp. IBVHS1]